MQNIYRSEAGQPLEAAALPDALLRLPNVEAMTGLSRPTIYRKVKAGEFPAPVRLGSRCSRWSAAAVRRWVHEHASAIEEISKPPDAGAGLAAMYSSALKCAWRSWRVVNSGHLALEIVEGHCCDMRGAIGLAQAICPAVSRVDTYMGQKLDTIYVEQNAKWKAITPGSKMHDALREAL